MHTIERIESDVVTEMSADEMMETVGGSCIELARAIGTALGFAAHVIIIGAESFSAGSSSWNWAAK